MPTTANSMASDSGARPIRRSMGAPSTMAKLLPVKRLLAAAETAEVKFAQVPLLASKAEGEEAPVQQAAVPPWLEALVNFLVRHRGRWYYPL